MLNKPNREVLEVLLGLLYCMHNKMPISVFLNQTTENPEHSAFKKVRDLKGLKTLLMFILTDFLIYQFLILYS